ncbi:MAG: hypothetical protein EPN93_16300 [Spirochaetes bacterium]|nr:MAG: hypothetical protein EPN93_16300 [Spirochaetota bacterium]
MERKKARKPGAVRWNVVPIDQAREADRWIVAPAQGRNKGAGRVKGFARFRGNCFFDRGIPGGLSIFIYRAVKKLGITGTALFFARGVVKKAHGGRVAGISIRELPWGTGLLITIPRGIRGTEFLDLRLADAEYKFRRIELLVLGALLRIARPADSAAKCSARAVLILARGWKAADSPLLPPVSHVHTKQARQPVKNKKPGYRYPGF